MVHVRGKRGRQVTPLFAEDENNAIKVLIQTRSLVGVEDSNVYVFAAPTRNLKTWLCENDCMSKILNQIEGLKSPDRLCSTQLRKYCATVTQVADLSDNDLRWFVDHLGHKLDEHREFYR